MENRQTVCYDKFNCGKCEERFGVCCPSPSLLDEEEEEEEGQVEVETITEKPNQCMKCQQYYCEICSAESGHFCEEDFYCCYACEPCRYCPFSDDQKRHMASMKTKEFEKEGRNLESKVLDSCLRQARETMMMINQSGGGGGGGNIENVDNALAATLNLAVRITEKAEGLGSPEFLRETRASFVDSLIQMTGPAQRKGLVSVVRPEVLNAVTRQLKIGQALSGCHYLISKHDRLVISKETIERVASSSGSPNNEVLLFLAKMYSQGILNFPYKSYYLPHYREMFDHLKTQKDIKTMADLVLDSSFGVGSKDQRGCTLKNQLLFDPRLAVRMPIGTEDQKSNHLVDHFQEGAKLRSRRSGDTAALTLEAAWKDYKVPYAALLSAYKDSKCTELNTRNVREHLGVKEFRSENISFIINVVKRQFPNAKRVLDFSMGWGERLIAFLALGVQRYVGFEHNLEMENGHRDICTAFNDGKTRTDLRYGYFEDFRLKKSEGTFDLIFTSPACFRSSNDAYDNGFSAKYGTFDRWLINYLFYSLYESWSFLDKGGVMCIRLEKVDAIEVTCLFILSTLEGATYEGVVCENTLADGVLTFKKRKISNFTRDMAEKARMELARRYDNIYQQIKERVEHEDPNPQTLSGNEHKKKRAPTCIDLRKDSPKRSKN